MYTRTISNFHFLFPANTEGLIAERYCFKVTLILLALAAIKRGGGEEEDTIIDVIVEAMVQLAKQFQKLEEKSSGMIH